MPPRPHGAYTTDHLKRQFSEAYVQAMAAVANVKCQIIQSGDDIDSVDAEFDSGRYGPGGVPLGINRKLEVQLKCTIASEFKPMPCPDTGVDAHRYYLARKDYDRLAIPQTGRPYPHVLVVMKVPPTPAEWLKCQGPLTLLRAKAWWLDLTDAPAATHTTRQPVYIPAAQHFDVAALTGLMSEPL